MKIALHKNARTTPTTRTEIAASTDSAVTLARLAKGESNVRRPDGLPLRHRWLDPLLLVHGADDPACGLDKQRLILAARSDLQRHELPDTGHYFSSEQPDGAPSHLTGGLSNMARSLIRRAIEKTTGFKVAIRYCLVLSPESTPVTSYLGSKKWDAKFSS